MKIQLNIPNYSPEKGLKCQWKEGFKIYINSKDEQIKILANKAGLESLASHFLNLAQEKVPTGYHFHFDDYNALEEGSNDIIIEKIE